MAKSTVFKDFFTNIAVAWFAAGVITPFLNPIFNQRNYLNSLLSAILAVGFIFLAKLAERKEL